MRLNLNLQFISHTWGVSIACILGRNLKDKATVKIYEAQEIKLEM